MYTINGKYAESMEDVYEKWLSICDKSHQNHNVISYRNGFDREKISFHRQKDFSRKVIRSGLAKCLRNDHTIRDFEGIIKEENMNSYK